MLDNNFVKLKDRQTSDIVIRLIVANVFRTTVRINRVKKTNESFVFIIMIKGHLYRTLENQLQSNIARYNLGISRTDMMFLNTIEYYS